VVHGIVKTLKGAVEAVSETGSGATFHVFLPRYTERPEPQVEPLKPMPRGTERILLLDDEAILVKMGRSMLERLGYRVTVCTRGSDALEVFRRSPQDFDLIISDKTMPGMTGFDLARAVKQIRADVPVILCSGYSNEVERQKALGMGISRLVLKPLSMDELANAVRAVLDEG
jgi:CheY-like chemotaxis protein